MTEPVPVDPNPELTAQLTARVRRMMLIAGLTTALGVGAVFVAIGYRIYRGEGSTPASPDVTTTLPKGARIVSTGIAGERIVVTLDVGGAIQIRTFDARTLKPAGHIRFVSEP
ncbi:MAG: hypothetical protein ACOY4O_10210 [Pseudomonadota bacterium]|jgi:long-subunit acyl-CoA synthetase (AMP-forming)